MNEKVTELIDNYLKPFRDALRVDFQTLKNDHPSVCTLELLPGTSREDFGVEEYHKEYNSEVIKLILKTLASATNIGVPWIVVHCPYYSCFEKAVIDELKNVGLSVEVMKTTRHRICDHNNGRGKNCVYADWGDGGAGEIADDLLFVWLPLSEIEARLKNPCFR